MKLLTLTAIVALAASSVIATPAGHMNLAKRSIIATQTLLVNGSTVIQVIDAVPATETSTTTVTSTSTETETNASYIVQYTGDITSLISHLSEFLSVALSL